MPDTYRAPMPNPAWVALRMTNRVNRPGPPPAPRDPIPVTIRVDLHPRTPAGPPPREEWVEATAIGWDCDLVYVEVDSDLIYLPTIWVLAADVRRRESPNR